MICFVFGLGVLGLLVCIRFEGFWVKIVEDISEVVSILVEKCIMILSCIGIVVLLRFYV